MKIHPAADLLPLLSSAEFQVLADAIAEHGLFSPITLWNGRSRAAVQRSVLVGGRERCAR